MIISLMKRIHMIFLLKMTNIQIQKVFINPVSRGGYRKFGDYVKNENSMRRSHVHILVCTRGCGTCN